jgi:hypothetical protein
MASRHGNPGSHWILHKKIDWTKKKGKGREKKEHKILQGLGDYLILRDLGGM